MMTINAPTTRKRINDDDSLFTNTEAIDREPTEDRLGLCPLRFLARPQLGTRQTPSRAQARTQGNLFGAQADVGTKAAVANIGSLRTLAAEATRDGELRSPWLAGWLAGCTTLAFSILAFVVLTLYYAEGVLDSGVTEPVTSSLFPFLSSQVTVDPSDDGIAFSFNFGFTPLIAAIAAWLLVAKPWRSFNSA